MFRNSRQHIVFYLYCIFLNISQIACQSVLRRRFVRRRKGFDEVFPLKFTAACCIPRKLNIPLRLHRFPHCVGLKGNAVRIGNSSRCCEFPDRDVRRAIFFSTDQGCVLCNYARFFSGSPGFRFVKYVQLLCILATGAEAPGRRSCFGTSQKTCRAFMRIRSCGEWVRISDECVVFQFKDSGLTVWHK